MLEKINFEGNTEIPDEELEKLALEVLGEDIFFDELLEVCSKVTNLYHEKGYLTSYATVPPQRIVDGVATIKIVTCPTKDGKNTETIVVKIPNTMYKIISLTRNSISPHLTVPWSACPESITAGNLPQEIFSEVSSEWKRSR